MLIDDFQPEVGKERLARGLSIAGNNMQLGSRPKT